jgi:hypothetical protein
MNHYYFDNKINNKTVNELVEKLQGLEGKINLWFTSDGGNSDDMYFLISYLNSRKEDIKITFTNIIQSAGTFILTDFLGEIILGEGLDCFMFHKIDRLVYTLRNSDSIQDKKLRSNIKLLNKNFAEKIKNKQLLTEKQLVEFNKGKDVVIYRKQFERWNIWEESKITKCDHLYFPVNPDEYSSNSSIGSFVVECKFCKHRP